MIRYILQKEVADFAVIPGKLFGGMVEPDSFLHRLEEK